MENHPQTSGRSGNIWPPPEGGGRRPSPPQGLPGRDQTHVWDEVKQGVAAQRAHRQRHQEAEQELEEDFAHERDEDDAEQREQADDGDGDEAAQPGCRQQHSVTTETF